MRRASFVIAGIEEFVTPTELVTKILVIPEAKKEEGEQRKCALNRALL